MDETGDPAQVFQRLSTTLEEGEDLLTSENVRAFCGFLLHAGLCVELIQFVAKHIMREDFEVPWPHLIEAISRTRPHIDDTLADSLLEGIDKTDMRADASRSKALDLQMPALRTERADRKLRVAKNYAKQKDSMLEQLITLRTQQLYEQEKRILSRLQKMYPRDPEVQREVQNHKERYALEILSKHSRLGPGAAFTPDMVIDVPEELKAACADMLVKYAQENPELAKDFAVAAAMLEMWDAAVAALATNPGLPGADWIQLDLLLGSRRYLDLLNALSRIEQAYSENPETFFATAYLRAQALWGLGQKHQAIEVLESLLSSRPQYRSGTSLLALWRGL